MPEDNLCHSPKPLKLVIVVTQTQSMSHVQAMRSIESALIAAVVEPGLQSVHVISVTSAQRDKVLKALFVNKVLDSSVFRVSLDAQSIFTEDMKDDRGLGQGRSESEEI